MLQDLRQQYQDREAFVFLEGRRERKVSYLQFLEDVEKTSREYKQIPQKRLGLWGDNSYSWICNAAAMLLAGKTLILLDVNLEQEELLGLAGYTDTELLIVDEDIYDSEDAVRDQIPMMCMEHLKKSGSVCQMEEEGEIICFTSGTSRSSKGVVISAEILAGCAEAGVVKFPGNAGERIYLPLPYHHIYGFTHIFHILKRGGIICIGHNRYLKRELECLFPKTALLVPSMLQYLMEKDLIPGSLYGIATGGGMLRTTLAETVETKGIELYNLYGLSETLGEISAGTGQKGYEWQKPQDGVRFVLKETGELGIVLPFHLQEYYKKPDDTRKVLNPEKHLLWTGDLAEMDAEGYVKIKGRMRDTIVLENGEKIHAEDTDAELNLLEGVLEAAVFGVNGKLVAAIVKEPESSEEKVMNGLKVWNRKKNAYARITGSWFYQKSFPRTTTGKLKRFQLEQEYLKFLKEENRTGREDGETE